MEETAWRELRRVTIWPSHSITYRIAVDPQAGRKVFTLQALPGSDPDEYFTDTVGKVAGFSLHAGVAAKGHELMSCGKVGKYHWISGKGVFILTVRIRLSASLGDRCRSTPRTGQLAIPVQTLQ